MIKRKKRNFVVGKLDENIGKPKELWKSLKSLGLPSKHGAVSNICLGKDNNICFDPKTNAEKFKDFFANLAANLLKELPNPKNKYNIDSTNAYYKHLKLQHNNFRFNPTNKTVILKFLEEINPNKAPGIDNLSGRFLKDGASLLANPITQICNLSISMSTFPEECKIAKLKPLFKKGSKIEAKNYRPISLYFL